ncbi:DNA polymerase theta-like [Antedon mediterranea]|uniref:DNA polymerase theta-like n=1 Tax=Antedon mediterranea TaxID=105859 RepID=UPI003AF5ED8D
MKLLIVLVSLSLAYALLQAIKMYNIKLPVSYSGVGEDTILELAQTLKLTKLFELISKLNFQETLFVQGPFTLFAPSDDAFRALHPYDLHRLQSNNELLTDVLLYHISGTKISSDQFPNEQLVPSRLGSTKIRVNVYDKVIAVNGCPISMPDQILKELSTSLTTLCIPFPLVTFPLHGSQQFRFLNFDGSCQSCRPNGKTHNTINMPQLSRHGPKSKCYARTKPKSPLVGDPGFDESDIDDDFLMQMDRMEEEYIERSSQDLSQNNSQLRDASLQDKSKQSGEPDASTTSANVPNGALPAETAVTEKTQTVAKSNKHPDNSSFSRQKPDLKLRPTALKLSPVNKPDSQKPGTSKDCINAAALFSPVEAIKTPEQPSTSKHFYCADSQNSIVDPKAEEKARKSEFFKARWKQEKAQKPKVSSGKVNSGKKKKKRKKKYKEPYTSVDGSQGFELSGLSMSTLTPPPTTPNRLLLSSWGLPDPVLAQYHKKNITKMFEWQAECLGQGSVLDGGNLVYSAPTSAGKTMVAELLVLKRVIETRKKAIVVLPFVSVTREKMFYLQAMFQDVGIKVDGYMGSVAPAGGFDAIDIAVCTIEKANSLINRLLEEKKLDQLGIVVVDELHMVGDNHRGYLLELLLTKIIYVSNRSLPKNSESNASRPNGIQIVGMSATLPNLDLLAKWLEADLYKTDFRPVPLTEMVKLNNTLFKPNMEKIRDFYPGRGIQNDQDCVISLTFETISDGHSVLIFCPTKNWCEKLAESIAREIYRFKGVLPVAEKDDTNNPDNTPINLNFGALKDVTEQLKRTPVGIDAMLKKTVPYAVAYHHAGLTFDERDIVEGAFRQGIIKVLVATSTLSSGVNLPARRVIIRTPSFNRSVLDTLTYRQMAGRAGRKGIDTEGESILVCKPSEKYKAEKLVKSKLSAVHSCLQQNEELSSSMKRAILEVIASGVASTPAEVQQYSSSTLLAASLEMEKQPGTSETKKCEIENCIEFLKVNEFIHLQTVETNGGDVERFVPTQLGSATLSSAMSPDEALAVFAELQRARKNFVLENELHIIYQVTPIYQSVNPDWYQFLCQWENFSMDKLRVAELVGIEERFLLKAAQGSVPNSSAKQKRLVALHQRFYTALLLSDLVNEVPLSDVSHKFGCPRGQLQSLQQSAATFAGMVTIFCNKLGWLNMELLVSQFHHRLNFGIQRELSDLIRISLLNAQRARLLYNSGLHTVANVAASNPAEIETLLRNAVPFQSTRRAEGELECEAMQRKKSRCIWATGRKGLTEEEAAGLIVMEAKQLLQADLKAIGVNWNASDPTPSKIPKATNRLGSSNKRIGQPISSNSFKFPSQRLSSHRDKRRLSTNTSLTSMDGSFERTQRRSKNSQIQRSQRRSMNSQLQISMAKSPINVDESLSRTRTNVQEKDVRNTSEQKSDEMLSDPSGTMGTVEDNLVDEQKTGLSVKEQVPVCLDRQPETPKGVSPNKSDELIHSPDLYSPSQDPNQAIDGNINEDVQYSIDVDSQEDVINNLDQNIQNSVLASPEICSEFSSTFPTIDSQLIKDMTTFCNRNALISASASPLFMDSCKAEEYFNDEFKFKHPTVTNQVEAGSKGKRRNSSLYGYSNLQEDLLIAMNLSDSFGMYKSTEINSPIINNVVSPVPLCNIQSTSSVKPSAICVGSNSTKTSTPVSILSKSADLQEIQKSDSDSAKIYKLKSNEAVNDGIKPDINGDDITYSQLENDLALAALDGSSFSFYDSKNSTRLQDVEAKLPESMKKKSPICNKTDISKDSKLEPATTSNIEVKEDKIDIEIDIKSAISGTFEMLDLFASDVGDKKKYKPPPKKGKQDNKVKTQIDNYFQHRKRRSDEVLVNQLKSEKRIKQDIISPDKSPDDDRRDSAGDFIPPTPPKKKVATPKLLRKTPQRTKQAIKSTIKSTPRRKNKATATIQSKAVDMPSTNLNSKLVVEKELVTNIVSSVSDTLTQAHKRLIGSSSRYTDVATSEEDLKLFLDTQTQLSGINNISVNDGVFTIMDVCANRRLFESFMTEWKSKNVYCLSVACERFKTSVAGGGIGGRFNTGSSKHLEAPDGIKVPEEDIIVTGVSVCYSAKDAYFISFQDMVTSSLDDSLAQPPCDVTITVHERLERVKEILQFGKKNPSRNCKVKGMFDYKNQYKVLSRACGISLEGTAEDPKVAAWLLNPEAKERNLQGLVSQYMSQESHLLQDIGGGVGLGGLGLMVQNACSGRVRAAKESVLVFLLMDVLTNQLKNDNLYDAFTNVEMPVMLTIAKMELNGFGFNTDEFEEQKNVMQAKLTVLEQMSYQLAGHPFSLTSTKDIAEVLFIELRLPPSGDPATPVIPQKTIKSRGRPKLPKNFNTSKETLEKLKKLHALPGLILEWRRINNTLSKVVFPMQKEKVFNDVLNMNRIYGICQTHTSTGRVALMEPSIQNIPKDFEIDLPSVIRESPPRDELAQSSTRERRRCTGRQTPFKSQMVPELIGEPGPKFSISMRNAFCPFTGGLIVAADYSQLELRIIAHLSGDTRLIKILNGGGDVFKTIAAEWKGIMPEEVTTEIRQQAKQICYGIIYGIGSKALAEQLEVSIEDGAAFIDMFKTRYKGLKAYIESTTKKCRENGFVVTITGRRRYLPKIHDTNVHAKAQAERQAVNTSVQGSAADLVKKAMIAIDRCLAEKYPSTGKSHRHKQDTALRRRTRGGSRSPNVPRGAFLVLQLHDELIYEVRKEDVPQVARLVKYEMESAMKLSVVLPVKVHVGPTWGRVELMEL